MSARIIVSLLLVVPGGLIAWTGGSDVLRQHEMITTYVPVPAMIDSASIGSRVEGSGKSRRTVYWPIIHYRYRIAGDDLPATQVLPLRVTGERGWAMAMVDRYPPGARVDAYVHPDNPVDVFLYPEYDGNCYAALIFGVLSIAGLPWALAGISASGRQHQLPRSTPQGFEIHPRLTVRECMRASVLTAALAWAVVIPAFGHFLSVAPKPWHGGIWVGIIASGLLLVALAGLAAYFYRLAGSFDDARVWTPTAHLTPGTETRVRLSHTARAELSVESYSMQLVCFAHVHKQAPKLLWSESVLQRERLQTRPGRPIECEHAFRIPETVSPSTPRKKVASPVIRWWVEVTARIDRHPDYRERFPVQVLPAGEEVPQE